MRATRPSAAGEAVRPPNQGTDKEADVVTGFQKPPQRHWPSYGNDPLPTPAEALAEPFSAFPSWFLRIECDRCGKVQMANGSTLGEVNR